MPTGLDTPHTGVGVHPLMGVHLVPTGLDTQWVVLWASGVCTRKPPVRLAKNSTGRVYAKHYATHIHSAYAYAYAYTRTRARGAYVCMYVVLCLCATGLDTTSDTKCVCDTLKKTNEYGAYALAYACAYAYAYALRG